MHTHSVEGTLMQVVQRARLMLSTGLITSALLLQASAAQQACPLAELIATQPEDDARFGWSVAGAGDLFVVGAPKDNEAATNGGAAHVFRFDGTGWQQETKLLASNPALGDRAGWSVAVDSNRIVVGSVEKDVVGSDSGSCTIYVFDGTAWLEEAILTPANGAPNARFGASVALSGGLLAVGAPGSSTGGPSSGSVYLYRLLADQWVPADEIVASDAVSGEAFGTSVSLAGVRVAVGAPADNEFGNLAGAAYVFRFDGAQFVQEAKLRSADSNSSARVGQSVAIDGTKLIAGGYLDSTGVGVSGSATVFKRTGTSWLEERRLVPSSGSGTQFFGFAVSLDGANAVVGAYRSDLFAPVGGAATLFRFEQNQWNEAPPFAIPDLVAGDQVGYSVAAFDDHVLLGAWGRDVGDEDEAGRALAFSTALDCAGIGASFCHGDGGDQLGCTPCPCVNDSPMGTLGGCMNSSGNSGLLLASGVASASADSLRVEATGTNPNTFGILVAGAQRLPSNPASPCFGLASGVNSASFDGLRCTGGDLLRLGTRASDVVGDIGFSTPGWGPPSGPTGGLVNRLQLGIGQTRHLQIIYREAPLQVCLTGLNTTQGVSITVQP